MILKKPYRFLIKNFRIIHFILSILIGYIIFKTSNLLYFINNYIQLGYFDRGLNLVSEYTNIYMFLITLVVIIISIIIYLLMRFKNKPRLFYFITIIVYMAIFIALGRAYFNLSELQTITIDPRAIRLTRDIILILSFIQYFIIGNTLFTMTGFNIKKFNFQEDLEDLEISETDDEEFEFVLGFDVDEFKIKLRNKLRNAKYILVENKYVFLVLMVLFSLLIATYIILRAQFFDGVYQEKELIVTNKYELNIVDSYVTANDYRGERISDKYNYVIIKLNIKNLTTTPRELATSNITLRVGNQTYHPLETKHELFQDLGRTHVGQTLPRNVLRTYILVYEIEKANTNRVMDLRVISRIVGNDIEYKRVNIRPENLDEIEMIKNVKLSEPLEFRNSILNNTKLLINGFEISEEFTFEYELCIAEKCYQMKDNIMANTMTRHDKTLLKLNFNFELDETLVNLKPNNIYELIENFGVIRYEKNGELIVHDVEINNMTPKYYPDDSIFIDVLKEVQEANKIDILFRIRNKEYIYTLK